MTRPYEIASLAEYRPEHYRFSRVSTSSDWERRLPPIKSGMQWFLHGVGVVGFFFVVFAVCFWR